MQYKPLDTVVLNSDVPEHQLRSGDLGAIVQRCPPNGLEVEFVNAAGNTPALVTLSISEVRPVSDTDVIAVRPLNRSA